MQTARDVLAGLTRWLSIRGRINRTDFWLCYFLPAAAFVAAAWLLSIPALQLVAALVVGSGVKKRWQDINAKVSSRKIAVVGALWIVVSVVAVAAAFIFFLGGISGLGSQRMLESAGILIAIPFAPVLLALLMVVIVPGSRDESVHGPVPRDLSLGRKQLPAFIVLLLLISVVSIGSNALHPSESGLIQAINAREGGRLELLLREGADPNQRTLAGTTALMLALEEESFSGSLSGPLLKYGADPRVISIQEREARDSTTRSDSEAQPPLTRHTPLVYAISRSRYDFRSAPPVVERMIEAGANVDPDPAHAGELSPLVAAARDSDSEMMEMLIAYGVDLSAPSNQPALMEALAHRDVKKVWLLLGGDRDLDQLDSAIALVDREIDSDSSSIDLRTLGQLLREDFNRELGKEQYPYRQFFSGAPQQIQSLTTYTQRRFRTPIRVRSMTRASVYDGPDFEYERVGSLYGGQELVATAITDAGNHIVWFRVRYGEPTEGYVFGASLCSLGDWYRGLRDGCRFVFDDR